MSRDRPVGRCPECGNVLKMEYVGPPDDPHEGKPVFFSDPYSSHEAIYTNAEHKKIQTTITNM